MEELIDFDWSEQKSINFLDTEGGSDTRTRSETPPLSQPGETDFDYKAYIFKELSQFDTANMEPVAKKKLVQKIRNRMSAQRSRQKAKGLLERLQEENLQLKNELTRARNHIASLQDEIGILRGKTRTFNDDPLFDSPHPRLYRDTSPLGSPVRSFFVALVCVICLMLVSLNAGSDSTAVLKLGGVVPSLARSLPPSVTQLSTIRETCSIYCKDFFAPNCDPPSVTDAEASTAIAEVSQPATARLYCQAAPDASPKTIIVLHHDELLRDSGAYYAPKLHPLLVAEEKPLPSR